MAQEAPGAPKVRIREKSDRFSDEFSEVAQVLPYLYLKLAEVCETLVESSGETLYFADSVIEGYLPGQVFEIAKACRWLTCYQASNTLSAGAVQDPVTKGWSDPENGMIGRWLVNKRFEVEFFKHLEPGMEVLRRTSAANAALDSGSSDIPWKQPTPHDIIKSFLDKKRSWTKAKLIGLMSTGKDSGKGDDVDETVKQTLKRIYREPKPGKQPRIGMDARTAERLHRLVEIIVNEEPSDFGHITIADFCWTPK